MPPAGSRSNQAGLLPPLAGVDVAAAIAVEVWRADLAAEPTGVAPDTAERERAARMRDERARARFLASRAWLRLVLGRSLDVDPGAVRFSVTDRGKPSVDGGGDLGFSLSRSGGVALIALVRSPHPVGVDIERVRDDLDPDDLARRFFSPTETDALRHLPETDRRDAFFDFWVRKEAVVKASGAGLSDGVNHLDVRGSRVAGRWWVASIDAGPGFAAAVCVEGALGAIRQQDLCGS